MRTWSAARRGILIWAALALCAAPGWSGAASGAPATSLSPDQRPTLLIVSGPTELKIVHHAHPMPPDEAEQLALKLGLFIAGPIIRRRARSGWDHLPLAWRTDEPDRGFAAAIAAALDPDQQANWPWRALKTLSSSDEADAALARLEGQSAAVATFECELEDLTHAVQLLARANVRVIRNEGTAAESSTQISIRHYGEPIVADWGRPKRYEAPFTSGGPLDEQVNAAALDLSHALAFMIARVTTPTSNLPAITERYGDLPHKPKCAECRPGDPVLHEEPGRVWVQPSRLGGAVVLSLPVG